MGGGNVGACGGDMYEGEEGGRDKILEILEDGRGEGWMKKLQRRRGGKGRGRGKRDRGRSEMDDGRV